MKLLPFPILLLTVTVFSASLAACAAPIPAATFTPAPTSAPTETPIPPTATQTPAPPTETATATATPEILAPITIVTDLEHLSQADVVADGQEADYVKRIMAAYKSGQIENFSDKAVPPILVPGRFGFDFADHGVLADINTRPMMALTIVQDGNGGYKIIELWMQKDRTPGVVWGKVPKNYQYLPTLLKYIFDKDPKGFLTIFDGEHVKTTQSCQSGYGDTEGSTCRAYTAPDNVKLRNQAMDDWINSGFIPQEIQNGKIWFLLTTVRV